MSNTSLAQDNTQSTVTSNKVADNLRLSMLPKYFPSSFMVVENSIYRFTEKLCKQYRGGYWEFYELSNGGFYMAPNHEGQLNVVVPFGNQFEGDMSADALGITICLFVYSFMAEDHPLAKFDEHYWNLRNFAYNHKESSMIFAALD